jgi:hypothetical protein
MVLGGEVDLDVVDGDVAGDPADLADDVAGPVQDSKAGLAVLEQRVDEILVSTLPGERSGWLRRDLVERLRKDTGLPVDHVVSANNPVPA